jgi:hypothetical protein
MDMNEWQETPVPMAAPPEDPRLIELLRVRGEYFDQFAPKNNEQWMFGSRGRRSELPVQESDAIVVARFSSHTAHRTISGRCVYTEMIFTPRIIVKAGPGQLAVSHPISLLDQGGAVIQLDGTVIRSPTPATEHGLVPGKTYLLFMRYTPAGDFYGQFKVWDVTTGFAVPNSTEDIEKANAYHSDNAGVSVDVLVGHVKLKLEQR